MYATILDELELANGLSFLNIGSGSGYLSCLAACLLGDCGLSHGIEILEDNVAHSTKCCETWFRNIVRCREGGDVTVPIVSKEGVAFVHGNCFHIDLIRSASTCKYDRIYIGAGCPEARKEFFFSLLSDDGILVAPIQESSSLVKIRRRHRHIFTETKVSSVIYAPLIEPDVEIPWLSPSAYSFGSAGSQSGSASASVASSLVNLSFLRSAENGAFFSGEVGGRRDSSRTMQQGLSTRSTSLVNLPPVCWAPIPSRHLQFPATFKGAVLMLLFASRQPLSNRQSSKQPSGGSACACGVLPQHIWTSLIIPFCSRDWFVAEVSERELILGELAVERSLRQSMEEQLRKEVLLRREADQQAAICKLLLRAARRDNERLLHLVEFAEASVATSVGATEEGEEGGLGENESEDEGDGGLPMALLLSGVFRHEIGEDGDPDGDDDNGDERDGEEALESDDGDGVEQPLLSPSLPLLPLSLSFAASASSEASSETRAAAGVGAPCEDTSGGGDTAMTESPSVASSLSSFSSAESAPGRGSGDEPRGSVAMYDNLSEEK